MTFLLILPLCLSLCYGIFICLLIGAILRPERPGKSGLLVDQPIPGVTVVIPFKNEAGNLPVLLESLNGQKYNKPLEVILVNDGSKDNYESSIPPVLDNLSLRILDSEYNPSTGLTPKQQALDLGIRSASSDWIALTDADMVLSQNWLSSLMSQVTPGIAMVFGHTATLTSASSPLFHWFQAFQIETLFGVAYAFNRCGLTGSCMGNNLLISKNAFDTVGGYAAIGHSMTEDCDLLRLFRNKRFPVVAAHPFYPTASTSPCKRLRDYYQQILRWAVGGFGRNPMLAATGLLLGAQNLLFIIALAGILSGPVALVVFCNLLLTWLFVAVAFRAIGSRQHPLHFWPFYLLFMVESLILAMAMVFRRPVIWKGRRL
ncbi:MAG: glycosyltransferase [Chitinispirillaceae bacterium]|nr:glycosyltransferase [Chitinispirillaceae bacterium]